MQCRLVTRDALLQPLLDSQGHVLSRAQALGAGLSRRAIEHRLASQQWQLLLPGVYLTAPGRPNRLQAQVAALLYAGEDAALDDVDACGLAGLAAVRAPNGVVFVVVPEGSRARSRGFVQVRRSRQPLTTLWATYQRRYLAPACALVAMSRRIRSEQTVLAAFSEAVQRRIVTLEQLVAAHQVGPPKFAAAAELALVDLGVGVRSAPEGTFHRLADASLVLGEVLYNRRCCCQTAESSSPTPSRQKLGWCMRPTVGAHMNVKTSSSRCRNGMTS